jgi:pimeloyl-ACP methyl ester carboxylesterase
MGASVAAFTAAEDERVMRLVLGGIGAPVIDRSLRAAQRERMKGIAEQLEAGDNDAIAEAVGGLFRAVASGDKEAAAALAAVMEANAEALPVPAGLIEAPTLVLVGSDDALAPNPERLVEALPNATLQLVPGDHLGALSRPEFRAALMDFLDDDA